MSAYEIEWAPQARKQLDRLELPLVRRVVRVVAGLAADPRPAGCTKLTGAEAWRIRVGDWRVVYTIEDSRLLVLIERVAHRREVYR